MATRIWHRQWWQIGITLAATSGVLFSWNSAIAQIAPDRTLGAESSVVTPNIVIKGLPSDRIDGGAIRGAYLFHSFQEFNVKEGRGAYFSNPASIENILTRVTGTNTSNIFGKLGVLGNANLFLLNPNGIIFGPNASLDINGSFVGSTANSLNFGDGKQFSATNPTAPPLLTVSVPLGVQLQFNQEQPRAIVNSGNLSVGEGNLNLTEDTVNLNLTGGTVVSTGQLSAPRGQVVVAAVPGGSVVNLNTSAELRNIETSSAVPNVGSSATLTELLGSSDERSHPGLTVNGNGQVSLVGSGLPVVDGDVVARNVTAQTGILTANHNLTLVESQLNTTGDLNLLAGDTVRVRDSVTNPFVAQAGGNLTIKGDKGIDILALNHPQTPFVSGDNLSLVSDGNISGDAHFSSSGDISITAKGNITTGALGFEKNNQGGNITIISTNGTINTTGKIVSSTPNGTSGNISLQAKSDITIANEISSRILNDNPKQEQRNAGEIQITSDTGNINLIVREETPAIREMIMKGDLLSTITSSTPNGHGGDIKLSAPHGEIRETPTPSQATTRWTLQAQSNNGVAGDVTLTAGRDIHSPNIQASSINSSGTDESNTIRLESSQGSVILDNVTLSTTNTGSDDAGDISISARDQVSIVNESNISSKGNAGRIFIGKSDQFAHYSSFSPSKVTINNSTLSTENSGIIGTDAKQIDAGEISIDTGTFSVTNNSSLISSTSRRANAGNIMIHTSGDIKIDENSSIESQVLSGEQGKLGVMGQQTTKKGNGGDITIDTGSLSITNGARISASTLGDGDAGSITIKNANFVNISGTSSTKGRSSGLFTSTETLSNGGDITINDTRNFKVSDGAVVDARTKNGGNGGDITLNNVKQVELINGGQLISTSSGSGNAGNIIVNATDRLIVNGSDATFKDRVARFGTKDINNVVNHANGRIVTLNDLKSSVDSVDSGLFVRSEGTGSAGDIKVNSPKIRLDNRGRFIADSNASGGGDITLEQNRGVLLLRHDSIISASAGRQGGGGNGGNITINNGFIVTPPNENTDIFTNAFDGQGGEIHINAFGLINIEKLSRNELESQLQRQLGHPVDSAEIDPQNLSSNDITAISQKSPDPMLQGELDINAPNLDPTHGLIQLPADLGDSSRLIAQSCPVGGQRATSQFIVTGRGGLPPNPSSALSSETFLGNAAAIAFPPRENPSPSASVPLQEAQGVEVGLKGEILLTARPSKLNYSTSVKKFRGCYGK